MAERNLDFDEIIERRGTLSLKYDFAERRGKPVDVLPLWVADMDFRTSSYIQDELIKLVQHGVFGYSETQTPYYEVVSSYIKDHYGYDTESERFLVKTPGVVFAIATAVNALTEKGDTIMIQQPVYYPFSEVINDNKRKLVDNTLVYSEKDNRYYIDFEDFEKKIVSENVKLFLLCNPHNPVARAWTKEELITLGEICLKHNVIVVSDEIHADFTFKGKHHVFSGLKPEFEQITVTCTSPSKTFNLAGLQVSNVFIKNLQIRNKYRQQYNASGFSQLNVAGLVACQTAYLKGQQWYDAMIKYVGENISFTKKYVEENLPGVKMIEHEATYLVWLNFKNLGLSPEELDEKIVYGAKLWLDSGKIFGVAGEGFQRINVATPRKILHEALERIKKVLY